MRESELVDEGGGECGRDVHGKYLNRQNHIKVEIIDEHVCTQLPPVNTTNFKLNM